MKYQDMLKYDESAAAARNGDKLSDFGFGIEIVGLMKKLFSRRMERSKSLKSVECFLNSYVFIAHSRVIKLEFHYFHNYLTVHF